MVSGAEPKKTENTNVNNSSQASILNEADYRYLMPPISGVISSAFDAKTDHLGVDILAPHDTPVKAIWDGHVITADWTLETGYTIGIQHSNDMVSFYKHNASLLKKTGAFVRAGEAVAIIGNTGKLSSGPHLHFELWLHGKPVDPTNYIDF
jgi:murein DD-endopeptidase MepM/ murein hydrolase activator NlpD